MKDIEALNSIIAELRDGKISGTLQIEINDEGKVKNIFVRRAEDDITKEINKIKLSKPVLRGANFSSMSVSGPGLERADARDSDFSYSTIIGADMSYANLAGASFYKARISQTNMANSYGIRDLSSSYLTGSVNLYNVSTEGGPISNPYDYFAEQESEMPDDKRDISRLLMGRKGY